MKKTILLKKKLKKFAIKAAVIVVICSGIAYFANYYVMQKTTILQQNEGVINEKRSEIATIEDNVNIYEKSFDSFKKLSKKLKDGQYELDVRRSGKVMELLGRKHRISNLSVNISAKQPLSTIEYIGFNPIFREIDLKFTAMSDAHIYAFLSNIEQYSTGYLQCSKITINQKRSLDSNVLTEASKGTTTELLDVGLSFLWLGIEQKIVAKDKI